MANSAKCPRCEQGSLRWDRSDPMAPKLRHYFNGRDVRGYLFFKDDVHVCADLRGETEPELETEEVSTEVDLDRDIPRELPTAAPTAAPALDQDAMRTFVRGNLTELAAGAASAAVSVAVTGVREQVAAAVADMVPVEHRMTVKRTDGTEIKIDGRPHRLQQLVLDIAAQRVHLMLVGPAGSGKTTAGEIAARSIGLRFFEASMGPQTSQWDLLGFKSPTSGEYVPGVLREPYEKGGVLLLDEIDNSNASVLTVLNSALANGHCAFPDGVVKRHADFVLVASGNTFGRGADRQYVGRQQLDAATLDRFAVLDWDYDEDAELVWAGSDQRDWVAFVQRVRKIAADGKMRFVVSPRASINGGKLLRAGIPRHQVEELVLWKGISADDRAKITANLR